MSVQEIEQPVQHVGHVRSMLSKKPTLVHLKSEPLSMRDSLVNRVFSTTLTTFADNTNLRVSAVL